MPMTAKKRKPAKRKAAKKTTRRKAAKKTTRRKAGRKTKTNATGLRRVNSTSILNFPLGAAAPPVQDGPDVPAGDITHRRRIGPSCTKPADMRSDEVRHRGRIKTIPMWIDRAVKWLLPREEHFYDLIERGAARAHEISTLLAECCVATSHADREVIVETYYRGRSVAEAAAGLGIPAGTVKSRAYYALRSLRLLLEERGWTTG